MPASSPDPAYQQIERGLTAWAAARDDLRALILIGSRARAAPPPDAWSDLDAIVFVDDTAPYRAPGDWQAGLEAAFGREAWFGSLELIDDDTPEWEYVLAGGLKVDLAFARNRAAAGRQADLSAICAAFPLNVVFVPGARVLVDNTGGGPPLRPPEPQPAPPPDQAAFQNRVANCLNELVRAARLSARGERWRAAKAINEELRPALLALIEWQAGQKPGYGRFLEEWAAPRVLAALPATYTDSTPAATARAVLAVLDLLEWLAPAAALRLGLACPDRMLRETAAWLRNLFDPLAS